MGWLGDRKICIQRIQKDSEEGEEEDEEDEEEGGSNPPQNIWLQAALNSNQCFGKK